MQSNCNDYFFLKKNTQIIVIYTYFHKVEDCNEDFPMATFSPVQKTMRREEGIHSHGEMS